MLDLVLQRLEGLDPRQVLFRVLDRDGAPLRELAVGEFLERVDTLILRLTHRLPQTPSPRGEQPALVLLHSDPDHFAVAFLAGLRAGFSMIPLPPPHSGHHAGALNFIRRVIEETGATSLLTDSESAHLFPIEGLPESVEIMATDHDEKTSPGTRNLNGGGVADREPDRIDTLLYTSGSTMDPKGVALGARAFDHYARSCSKSWGIDSRSALFSWMPSHHSFGLIFNVVMPLSTGCPLTSLPAMSFLEAPLRWLRGIDRFRATHTAAATFGYRHLIERVADAELTGLDLSRLELALIGAEPIQRDLCELVQGRLRRCSLSPTALSPIYGLSETGPVATDRREDRVRFREPKGIPLPIDPAFVGRALDETAIRITNPESGKELEPGAIGEVQVSSPALLEGYFQRPELTEKAIVLDGSRRWFRTGDLGCLEDGRLCVTGRIKEMMIVRGRKFFPQDVELLGRKAAGLRGGAAAFLESESGEIVLLLESDAATASVAELARTAVASELDVSVLVRIVPPGAIPRTSAGKIQRGRCRELWEPRRIVTEFDTKFDRVLDTAPDTALDSALDSAPEATTAEDNPLARLLVIFARQLKREIPTELFEREWSEWQLDSLQCIEIAAEIERAFPIEFSPTSFFRRGSLRELARTLGESSPGAKGSDPNKVGRVGG